ncbi:isoleucine--tRNA ligase [Streptobacillus moniliformis]|uniref:Isoleucine--tRNA ligase n=1 Tax=Streptobacillus moniliformis (strain ATCC 14647 / DSM 12112 / NCTC 10651 / 9901) TaxID=519441 RepID=D1AUZ6_STRM9|nr:isoleucine--tRNA ligase [Streptobacillus moniliformis]ACZ01556.1 isoleucyl-tRNA synthetase [Streptobacillus moniliformis DSM 12112]AVL43754.1 isoleucine--tRNA ligase [Streptobacillus moniliformis]SQA13277.1 Isoleucine--tRNA ligase [Streptobacillus moniliformis]
MSEENKVDYASTLNLPKTSFKMKANLSQKEPLTIRDWEKNKIYEKSLDNEKPTFFLHDGPPYANGNLHIGHAINKVLKDIILKYKRLQGFNAPYIPGWDTHGLPIEWKMIQDLGEKAKEMSPLELRNACKKYALKSVEMQKKDFIRLGILGDWNNPYITLNKEFEAEELRVFRDIYENGYVYKGLKPVYWSPTTETALAEAEIEYKDVESDSIYVKMNLTDETNEKLGVENAAVIIWTTTPWTIPANLAISLNENFVYGVYKTEKGNLILSKSLAEKAFNEMNLSFELIKEIQGKDFERLTYKHPIYDRVSMLILGDHVTEDAGTGCVHTAPGHGVDDYNVSLKYGIGILSPVDDKGHMTSEAPRYEGLFYKKANSAIMADLENSGHLLGHKKLVHSYPHDWRSKKPVIFRATEQWFIKVDGEVRENTLEKLEEVEFVPAWGRNRITSMMENRPDWTISRQRVWGVPIPIFYNAKTNEVVYESEIMSRVIDLVEKEGTDIWWKYSAKDIIGEELLIKHNLKDVELRKERSILDVWFDSGVSHRAVLRPRGYNIRPVDLYLEGSDQHRGWFQSSLLTSVASTFDSPYKKLLTHGFVMDGQGRKMSKSLGNTITPKDIIDVHGADILRLWVSSVDYREDVRISDNIIQQMTDSYRKIRNTARYLLGNINDFDRSNKVAYDDMLEIDKWAMHKLEELKEKVTKHYENYEFYSLFQEILYFCSVEMSSFYLDIIKDRLYCEYKDSLERRSAQSVLVDILDVLVRIISPVLSFTAEEIWERLDYEGKEESVHLASWIKAKPEHMNEELAKKWQILGELRKEVNKKIEKERQNGSIGLSLDARVLIKVTNDKYEFIKEYSNWDISDIFLVSQVEFTNTEELESTDLEGFEVKIVRALGKKCERCWKYSEEVGQDLEYPDVTLRDAKVLKMLKGL